MKKLLSFVVFFIFFSNASFLQCNAPAAQQQPSKTWASWALTGAGIGLAVAVPFLAIKAWQAHKKIPQAKEYDEVVFTPIETALKNNKRIEPENLIVSHQNLSWLLYQDTQTKTINAEDGMKFVGAPKEHAGEFDAHLYRYNKGNKDSEAFKNLAFELLNTYLGKNRVSQQLDRNPPIYVVNACQRKYENRKFLYGISAIAAGATGAVCLYFGNRK